MEIENEVKTVRVAYQCDVCKVGEMFPTELTTGLTCIGSKIEHKCEHCGHLAYFDITYPATYYK
jgi:hypothetical protein